MKDVVAQVCFSESWGGLEMSSLKIAREFSRKGHRSLLICKPNTPIFTEATKQGIELLTIDRPKYFSPKAVLQFRRHVLNHQIKVLALHQLRDLWVVRPAIIGLGNLRLIGFARMFLKSINKKDLLHRWLYRRLNCLIALSFEQTRYLKKCLPLERVPIQIIPNGVDTERFSPNLPSKISGANPLGELVKTYPLRELAEANSLRELAEANPPGESAKKFLFGVIGRIDRQKGQLEFVAAAEDFLSKFHNSIPRPHFVIVGDQTSDQEAYYNEVINRIAISQYKEFFTILPHQTDIASIMNKLSVFVLPSYEENFANVLLEALSCGKACIGTNTGGTTEILDNGKTGLLVRPQDSSDLANAFERLYGDKNLREELAQRARRKVEADYDLKVVFDKIYRVSCSD